MKQRIAIIDGIRTPMAQAGKELRQIQADDLGAYAVKELLERTGIAFEQIDEVILGNVAQPPHAANIARVIALKAGLPIATPAYTVHRNCASGMESITTAADKILAGRGKVYVTGGTESMSHIPFLYSEKMKEYFTALSRARTLFQRLALLFSFRFSHLKPEIAVIQGLTDPVSGLIMGETAEVLAREFGISRQEQDEYALLSHRRAIQAQKAGIFAREIVSVPLPNQESKMLNSDKGPRENQSLSALGALKPYFDRKNGTVTVGNSCPLTDGAAALLIMEENEARQQGYEPLGYLKNYAYASLEPQRMGLGPVYAAARLLKETGAVMNDFAIVELNEAFAAQVIANIKAFSSNQFARTYLSRDKAVGELNQDQLNVNGGAIALGHPVGMTGARLVIHTLKELRRRNQNSGLATLCIGGGQGAALHLEVA